MTTSEIHAQIKKKNSFLCIGLDVDLNKIPAFLLEEQDGTMEVEIQDQLVVLLQTMVH